VSASDYNGSSPKHVEANIIWIHALYIQVVGFLEENSKLFCTEWAVSS